MQGCLKKASTNTTRSKTRGLLPGNLQTTPGLGHQGSSRCGGRHRELLLLDSNVDCSGRSGKTVKEIKAGEYLVYPRVLRPATKLLCMYQMDRGRLYSGLQDRNTRIRGNMLGLSKTSIFRRCLAAWGKNQPTVYININEITMKQKLLQQCIIVSCNNYQCFRVTSLDIHHEEDNSEPTV